jgi:hypothetical protein
MSEASTSELATIIPESVAINLKKYLEDFNNKNS